MRKNSHQEQDHKYTITKKIRHSSTHELYEELTKLFPTPTHYRQYIKSFSIERVLNENKQLKGILRQVTNQNHVDYFNDLNDELKLELEYRMCTTEELEENARKRQ